MPRLTRCIGSTLVTKATWEEWVTKVTPELMAFITECYDPLVKSMEKNTPAEYNKTRTEIQTNFSILYSQLTLEQRELLKTITYAEQDQLFNGESK